MPVPRAVSVLAAPRTPSSRRPCRGAGGGWSTLAAACVLVAAGAASLRAQPAAPPARKAPPPSAEALAPPARGLDTPEGELGYALGLQIGTRMADEFRRQRTPADLNALAQGLADALAGAAPRIPEARVKAALEAFDRRMQQEQEAFRREMAERGKANKAKAAAFLAENGRREGVVTLPSGLQYQVLAEGKGPKPGPTDAVAAHYRGTHLDGTEFDSSDPAQPPPTFPLQAVVPGWQEALPLMATGSKWRLWVPPDLAYGAEGSPPVIEPHEALVFEIELKGIEAARPRGARVEP
ncbi:MAG: FKBP-type peptidyl-prolyl cis-trans isomerase [Planctomycetaceae bacterium]